MKITIKLPEDVIARMLEVNRTPWETTPALDQCVERHLFEAAMTSEAVEGDIPDPMCGPPIVRQWTDITVNVSPKDLRWILTGIVSHEVRSLPVPTGFVLVGQPKKDDVEDDDIWF